MRCYVACLACYNAGILRGDWFEATLARDVTPREIHGGRETSHEELWVLDLDGDYWPVNREMSPHEAAEWAEVLDEVDEHQRPALAAWVRSGSYVAQGNTDLPCLSDFEEAYVGNWGSFREYSDQYVEDTGMLDGVDDDVARYWDFAAFARDLEMDHSVEPDGHGGCFIFRCL